MRIIGGQWRGRVLADLGAGDLKAHLRPSSDRFRETVFNILRGAKYNDAPNNHRVLDLFAGTGALSFEALSRGALDATLIDQGKTAITIIKQNAHTLNAEDHIQILQRDATDLGSCPTKKYDLVFLDPPYSQSLGEKAIKNAYQGGWLAPEAIIVWEDQLAPEPISFIELMDQRKIGRALLTIARLKEGI